VGDKARLAVVAIALSCSGPPALPAGAGAGSAGAGSAGAGSAGAAGSASAAAADVSEAWTWMACGTIPSTEVPSLIEYSRGDTIVGGHPRSTPLDAINRISALAMNADGGTLVSMGGVTLVWDVAPAFADSRATYVDRGTPEWPRVEVSPDGRWIAIFGDGRRLVSRDGKSGPAIGAGSTPAECWPAEARFSPDGQWLVGPGFGPAIDVFRVADFDVARPQLQPVYSLAAACGPIDPQLALYAPTSRIAFAPDGQRLVTETGAQFRTDNWQLVTEGRGEPAQHGLDGSLELSAKGAVLVSDCHYEKAIDGFSCAPEVGRFPRFSPDGSWVLAAGTLRHIASGEIRVLDASAAVGIFAPNGDVIAASADNSLTRYCKTE